ncbi:MAG: hypothetical protein J5I98_00670, partial [Phaeodactylibacter sp.]|nr:hypothetical protein [Phaeodactylibacter sp.]
ILGSHEGIFPPHSSATGRKNGKVRFQKLAFAAKMTTSKHALSQGRSNASGRLFVPRLILKQTRCPFNSQQTRNFQKF